MLVTGVTPAGRTLGERAQTPGTQLSSPLCSENACVEESCISQWGVAGVRSRAPDADPDAGPLALAHDRGLLEFDAAVDAVQEAPAAAKDDRHDVDVQLIYEPGAHQLLDDVGSAYALHRPGASFRLRLRDR